MICTSLNHRKRMKAEPSRQIPQKLASRLEFVLFSSIREGNHCYYLLSTMLTFTERTMTQEMWELSNHSYHGRNFVVKCGGAAWCESNAVLGSMQKWRFIYCIQITNLISRGVLRVTLITLCFVLADDLHINILKFVVGHGTVVQPVSINIVFGCKQAQQYSRTHHLGFIRTASWSAQNACIGRTCISLLQ